MRGPPKKGQTEPIVYDMNKCSFTTNIFNWLGAPYVKKVATICAENDQSDICQTAQIQKGGKVLLWNR